MTKTHPELTLVPILGESIHGQLDVQSMPLLGLGLELSKLLRTGIALCVEGLEGIEGGGREFALDSQYGAA